MEDNTFQIAGRSFHFHKLGGDDAVSDWARYLFVKDCMWLILSGIALNEGIPINQAVVPELAVVSLPRPVSILCHYDDALITEQWVRDHTTYQELLDIMVKEIAFDPSLVLQVMDMCDKAKQLRKQSGNA